MIEDAEIRYDTKYASGLISVQMPIYLGTLHPDPVANVWRTRIVDIINKERWEKCLVQRQIQNSMFFCLKIEPQYRATFKDFRYQ